MTILAMTLVACVALGLPVVFAYRGSTVLADTSTVQSVNTIGLGERQAEIQRSLEAREITQADADLLIFELEQMYVSDMESSAEIRVQHQRPKAYGVVMVSGLVLLAAVVVYAQIGSFFEAKDLQKRIEKVEPVVTSFLEGSSLSTEAMRDTPLADFAMALQVKTQKSPHDADLWTRLGQLMQTIPLLESAEVAYWRALEEEPQNVDVASKLIQVDLQRNGGRVSSMSRRVIVKLQQSSANPVKVEMLNGLVAFRANELNKAQAIWEGLLGKVDASERFVVDQSLALVNERIEQRSHAAGESRRIEVQVRVSDALLIEPGMRLFVTAKAVEGSKMPLAVKSYDLVEPQLSLELTSSDTMVSGNGLDQHSRVKVEAMVSLSGLVERTPGNWVSNPVVVDFDAQGPWRVEVVVDQKLADTM